jgi:acyl-CoA reductase-like NAD-dependent aldehyde dehydrogenase
LRAIHTLRQVIPSLTKSSHPERVAGSISQATRALSTTAPSQVLNLAMRSRLGLTPIAQVQTRGYHALSGAMIRFLNASEPAPSALDKLHNKVVLDQAKSEYNAGAFPSFMPQVIVSSGPGLGDGTSKNTVFRDHNNPSILVPVQFASQADIDKSIENAVGAELPVSSAESRILVTKNMLQALSDSYYGKSDSTVAMELLIGESLSASKPIPHVDTSMTELLDVAPYEIFSAQKALSDPALKVTPFGPSVIKSASNFGMLTMRQLVLNFVLGNSSIVLINEKISPIEKMRVDFVKAHFDKIDPRAVQLLVTDIPGSQQVLSQVSALLGTGSPGAARAMRDAGQFINVSFETGGKANTTIVTEKACPRGTEAYTKMVDTLIGIYSYANGQQCSFPRLLAVVGSDPFFDGLKTDLSVRVQELTSTMSKSPLEEGISALTGAPNLHLGKAGKWLVEPKKTSDSGPIQFTPGLKEINPRHPDVGEDQIEYWSSVANIGKFDSVSQAIAFMTEQGALTGSAFAVGDDQSTVLRDMPPRGVTINDSSMCAMPPRENFGGRPQNGTSTGIVGSVGPNAVREFANFQYQFDQVKQEMAESGYVAPRNHQILFRGLRGSGVADCSPLSVFLFKQSQYATELSTSNPQTYHIPGHARTTVQGMAAYRQEERSIFRVGPSDELTNVVGALESLSQYTNTFLRISISDDIPKDDPVHRFVEILSRDSQWDIHVESEPALQTTLTKMPGHSLWVEDKYNLSPQLKKQLMSTDAEIGSFALDKTIAAELIHAVASLEHVKVASPDREPTEFVSEAQSLPRWIKPAAIK